MVHRLARLANLVLAGMLTGNELGSRMVVHPALAGLPPRAHVEAEQALTRRYGRIMPAFMTTTLASFVPVLALTPQDTTDEEFVRLRARWDRLHTARNVLDVTGLTCTALAASTS